MGKKVKDIALNHYRFYLSEMDGDGEEMLQAKENAFRQVLEGVITQAGGWAKTKRGGKPDAWRRQGMNLLLTHTQPSWIIDGKNQLARKVISRSWLDVFSVQTGIARTGDVEISDIVGVIQGLPSCLPPEAKYSLPGRCLCIFLELAEEIGNYKLDDIFDAAFQGAGYENPRYRELDLGSAQVALLENTPDAAWVVVPVSPLRVNRAGALADDVLPEYFLSWAKIANERRTAEYDKTDAKAAKEALEEFLRTQSLEQTVPKSLSQMEEASEGLADLRTALAVAIARGRRHLHTMSINIGNAERLLENSLLYARKDELQRLLVKPLQLPREQLEADLSYYEIELTKGDLVNEKLKDLTQIRNSVWSRRLAVLFGLLSLLGIFQLFPEFGGLQKRWRIPLLVGLGVIFLVWTFSPEIRRFLSRKWHGEKEIPAVPPAEPPQLTFGQRDYITPAPTGRTEKVERK